MKQQRAVRAILCGILCISAARAAEPVILPPALAPGDLAPGLRGTRLSDGQIVIVDWADARLNVVNFWASWCTYCKDQMPVLQQMQERQRDKGVRVIGVNHQPEVTLEDLAAYSDPLGVKYFILHADESTNYIWGGIQAMPTTFLIDNRGIVLRRYVGATPEQTRGIWDDVEAVLEGRPMGKMVIPEAPAVSDAPRTMEEMEQKNQEAREYQP